jgi:hypothetical protein
MSPHTVDTHLRTIYRALGVRSPAQARRSDASRTASRGLISEPTGDRVISRAAGRPTVRLVKREAYVSQMSQARALPGTNEAARLAPRDGCRHRGARGGARSGGRWARPIIATVWRSVSRSSPSGRLVGRPSRRATWLIPCRRWIATANASRDPPQPRRPSPGTGPRSRSAGASSNRLGESWSSPATWSVSGSYHRVVAAGIDDRPAGHRARPGGRMVLTVG